MQRHTPTRPASGKTTNRALEDRGSRETLFGDLPLDRWPAADTAADVYPWSAFVEARTSVAAGRAADAKRCWRNVVAHAGLEPRHYLQAWHFLREHGEHPPQNVAKAVIGVVAEMGLREGLDVLAVYSDLSARYYNHTGGGIVLDRAEGSVAELIDALLAAAADVVARIGPRENARPGPPRRNYARLSFLTPSGLHFGEGPTDVVEADPLAGPVLRGATAVLTELVAADAHDGARGAGRT